MNSWVLTLLVVFVVFGSLAAGWFLVKGRFPAPSTDQMTGQDVSPAPSEQPSAEELYESVKQGKSLEQLKQEQPAYQGGPNIAVKEVKDQIMQEVNPEPENVVVEFSGSAFLPKTVTVTRGDVVTWKNNSSTPMTIVSDGWGNKLPVNPGGGFSQGFDLAGRYAYHYSGNEAVNGEVVVE